MKLTYVTFREKVGEKKMRIIEDPARLAGLWERYELGRWFDLPPSAFQLRCYERGELLSSPMIPVEYFLILLEGDVHFFSLNQEGRQLPLWAVNGQMLLGDMEFVTGSGTLFYSEAKSKVLCLALPMERHRAYLEENKKFLHLLIYSLATKIQFGSSVEIPSATIEERVLLYLRSQGERHEIRGISATALRLRCSQRQLLRSLKKLCAEGLVEKTGHGVYRLTDKEGALF